MNLSRSSSKTRFDVVIVGGGHNGLTCAAYLAHAGLERVGRQAGEEGGLDGVGEGGDEGGGGKRADDGDDARE